MSNPILIWIASQLGWEVGPVVAFATAVIIGLGVWLLVFLMVDLPHWLASKKSNSSGGAAAFFGILLIIAVVISIFLNFVITILFIVAMLGIAGGMRDWWFRGSK